MCTWGFFREQPERGFWDESLYHMRDKSKDYQGSTEDNYYGIKGVKRKPNAYVVGLVMAFVTLGIVVQFSMAR